MQQSILTGLAETSSISSTPEKAQKPRRSVRLLKNGAVAQGPAFQTLRQIKGRSILTGEELNREELTAVLDVAIELKADRSINSFQKSLEGMHLALLFEKASLRTRFSFAIAMSELGGFVIDSVSSSRKAEEPEDLIRVLNGYCHGVMLRTHEHSVLERMVTKTTIPIVNGLSDDHHPCQILADLMTLKENFKSLEGLTLSYIGDGNNILHSLLLMAPVLGVNVHFSCPRGFGPSIKILEKANQRAVENGATVKAFSTPEEAVDGAHAIYTDVWTSMGFEDESEQRNESFKGFQINKSLFERAQHSAVIMHCLPMLRGKEITDEMADHPQSVLFQQSENRLHAQKALLLGLMGR